MKTTKPVNLSQLQAEALALGLGHTCYSVLNGKGDATSVMAAGVDLYCQAADGSLSALCPAGMTAYTAHVAAAAALPTSPYTTLKNAVALATDPTVKAAIQAFCTAMGG